MVKSEERLKVLKMVQEGKITVEQATSLLEALEEMPAAAGKIGAAPAIAGAPAAGTGQGARWLRVRVTDTDIRPPARQHPPADQRGERRHQDGHALLTPGGRPGHGRADQMDHLWRGRADCGCDR